MEVVRLSGVKLTWVMIRNMADSQVQVWTRDSLQAILIPGDLEEVPLLFPGL